MERIVTRKAPPADRGRSRRILRSLACGLLGFGFLVTAQWGAAAADPDVNRRVREIELVVMTADVDPLAFEAGQLIARSWRSLGFDVKISPLDSSRFAEVVWTRKEYDVALSRFSARADRLDPDHWIYTVFRTGAHGNETLYSNPEFDRLADLQRTTADLEERRRIVFQAQELLAKDQPFTPIVHPYETHAYNAARFSEIEPMIVEGLNGGLPFVEMKPLTDRKILRWGFPQAVGTLNPVYHAVSLSHDRDLMFLIYDTLLRLDRKGYPRNWAAQGFRQLSPTVFEVQLRPGMKFHDGKPVTAEDVRFTYDLFSKEKASRLFGYTSIIKEIQILDELKLRFVLSEPRAYFVTLSLTAVPILPKHIWDGLPQKAGLSSLADWPNNPPIGSGPFKFDYWRRGEEMKLARNDGHFQKPNIEGVINIPYGDGQGTVLGLEKGENDLVSWNVGAINATSLAARKDIKVVVVRTNAAIGMDYNNARDPFKDARVRRALAYGIPKTKIHHEIYSGQADIGQAVIAPINAFWNNPKVEQFDLDLVQSRRLLQEAGYEWDSKGKIYGPARK